MLVLFRFIEEYGYFFLIVISRIELVSISEFIDKSWSGYFFWVYFMVIIILI